MLYEVAFAIDRSAFTYLLMAAFTLAIGVLTYQDFFYCDYVQLLSHSEWSEASGYSLPQFIALAMGTFTLPFAIVFTLIFAVQSFKSQIGSYSIKVAAYSLLSIAFFFAAMYSYNISSDIWSCGVFCFGDDAQRNSINDAAIISTGSLYLIFSVIFCLVFAYLAILSYFLPNNPSIRTIFQNASSSESRSGTARGYENKPLLYGRSSETNILGPNDNSEAYNLNDEKRLKFEREKQQRNRILLYVLVFLVIYPLFFIACLSLPTWWNGFTKYGIQKYQADVPSLSYGTYWTFTLRHGLVVLKLFPDILMYYGFIYVVALLAVLARHLPSISRTLSKRFMVPWLSVCKADRVSGPGRPVKVSLVSLEMWAFSLGEMLFTASLAALLISTFCYWYLDHGWEETLRSTRTSAELTARSLGQVSNMVMGLLLLPVSRNSAIASILGMSWENLIVYHTYMGSLFLLLIVAHALSWWVVFAQQGSFPHDIFAIPMTYHSDNFTVPLAVIGTLFTLICMGALAHHAVRRWNYDLFYWAHHFSLVVFLLMLWHATMSWYYIAASLTLYLVDHVIRFHRSVAYQAVLQDLNIVGNGNVVHLNYVVSKSKSLLYSGGNPFSRDNYAPLPHEMGQYVFINIPIISQLAWHPFTISSSPRDPMTSHHIKSQGNNQWTDRLLYLASTLQQYHENRHEKGRNNKAVSSSGFLGIFQSILGGDRGGHGVAGGSLASGGLDNADSNEKNPYFPSKLAMELSRIVVNIDGPYGMPLDPSKYKSLLLVAGGMGITPLISCYKYLILSYITTGKQQLIHMKRIKLVWTVKTYAEASIFLDTLRDLHIMLNDFNKHSGNNNSSTANNSRNGGSYTTNKNSSGSVGPQFSYEVYVTQDQHVPVDDRDLSSNSIDSVQEEGGSAARSGGYHASDRRSAAIGSPGVDGATGGGSGGSGSGGSGSRMGLGKVEGRRESLFASIWSFVTGSGDSDVSGYESNESNVSSVSSGSSSNTESNFRKYENQGIMGQSGSSNSLANTPHKVRHRRPDLYGEVMSLSPWGLEAMVYTCGPKSLVDACREFTTLSKVDFRVDTFEL